MKLQDDPIVQACIQAQIKRFAKETPAASLERIGAFLDVPETDLEYALHAPYENIRKASFFTAENLAGAVARARCDE